MTGITKAEREAAGGWPLCISEGPWLEGKPLEATSVDQLIHSASHELRGPMNGLGLILHLVERQVQGTRQVEQSLFQRGRRLMSRMTRVLDELLELSRINEGRFELVVQPLDLVRVVNEAVHALDGARGEDLRLCLPEEGLTCHGDRGRLAQVVGHLLDNAVEYTPPGTAIALSLRALSAEEGGGAEIVVSDNGPGLDPAVLAARLGRVQPHPGHTGLGVGLYLSALVVARHGGRLILDRPGVGGLQVTLRLPAPATPALH